MIVHPGFTGIVSRIASLLFEVLPPGICTLLSPVHRRFTA